MLLNPARCNGHNIIHETARKFCKGATHVYQHYSYALFQLLQGKVKANTLFDYVFVSGEAQEIKNNIIQSFNYEPL